MIKKIISSIVVLYILLIWVFQSSINSYYELTYQKVSPLRYLDQYKVWLFGKTVKTGIEEVVDKINNSSSVLFEKITNLYNYKVLGIKVKEEDSIDNNLPESNTNNEESLDNLINNINTDKKPIEPVIIDKIAGNLDYRNYSSEDFKDFLAEPIELTEKDKVLFIGDSLQQGVAPHVRSLLSKNYKIKTIDLSKQSTGLVYTDFFNWNKVLREVLASNNDIKLVVILVGANDKISMKNEINNKSKFLSFAGTYWRNAYLQRSMSLIYESYKHNAHVIWVELPNMRDKKLNQSIRTIREIQKEAAKQYSAIYIDTNKLFNIDNYEDYVSNINIDGKSVRIRTKDGIHFDIAGQKIIAKEIFKYIKYINSKPIE